MAKVLDEVENMQIVKDGNDLFVEVDGVRIAQRGHPGTPQDGIWVSIEPGWEVHDGEQSILVSYNGFSVH